MTLPIVLTDPGHGDGKLWIAVVAVVVLAPIVVGLLWRLADRRWQR